MSTSRGQAHNRKTRARIRKSIYQLPRAHVYQTSGVREQQVIGESIYRLPQRYDYRGPGIPRKQPEHIYQLHIPKRRFKFSWSNLKFLGRRTRNVVISDLRSARKPKFTSILRLGSKRDQKSDFEHYCDWYKIGGFGMEALSPRSSNIQVKPRTTKEKALAVATKAAADREAKKVKERNFAPHPPEWVIQPPDKDKDEVLSTSYRIGKFLGKGGFAICYEGKLQPRGNGTPTTYALKIVKAKMNQKKMEDKFRTELQIHAKMRHPNIVEFHRAFTFKESTFVVLELCSSGSVMDMVKKRKCLSLPEVRRFTMQLCGAVKYMHARNVIHRDLKMGNLFLDRNMNLKLGDFGLAAILVSPREFEAISRGAMSRRTTLCGTPNYIAPEILEKGKNGHDHKVDIWAIGVILFAMIAGSPPFQAMTPNEIYRKAREVDYAWPENEACENDIPGEAKDLVARVLKVDAELRLDLDQIVGHPFFGMHGGRNIPMIMEQHCLHGKPDWLSPQRPRGDVFEGGHARWDWSIYAESCGVGHLPGNPQPFDVVGDDAKLSIYTECMYEDLSLTYPIVPMPMDMVYTPHPIPKGPPLRQSSKSSQISTSPPISTSRSSCGYAQSTTTQESISVRQAEVENESRRHGPIPSHAATLRASRVRSRPSRTVIRAAPGPSSTKQQVPASSKSSSPERATINAASRALGPAPVRPTVSAGSQRMRKAPSHTTRVTRSKKVEPVSLPPDPPNGLSKLTTDQCVDQVSSNSDEVRREKATRTKVSVASAVQREMSEPLDRGKAPVQSSLPQRSRQLQKSAIRGNVLIGSGEASEYLPNTKPDEVLVKLQELHSQLTIALIDQQSSMATSRKGKSYGSAAFRNNSIETRPVVVKWVDYTNKFGIGYTLANGTVGCVFKGDEECPPTCVVVAGAENHFKLRKIASYSEKHQIVPKHGAPVEFIENVDHEGIKRVFVSPTEYQIKIDANGNPGKLSPGDNYFDLQKRRKLMLWEKFGKYMTKTLGKSDSEELDALLAGETKHLDRLTRVKHEVAGPFVKFYQRLGNVGIWGFDNGTFQFNFPDHTKLVISDDGTWADFYHLSVRAARILQEGGSLKAEDLAERSVFTYPLAVMLRGVYNTHNFRDVVESNELMNKVTFIRDLVEIWEECGGLGRLGEHRWMKWKGIQENGWNMLWVSVGAMGGDARWELPAHMPDSEYAHL